MAKVAPVYEFLAIIHIATDSRATMWDTWCMAAFHWFTNPRVCEDPIIFACHFESFLAANPTPNCVAFNALVFCLVVVLH
jgi:hypothetical protein